MDEKKTRDANKIIDACFEESSDEGINGQAQEARLIYQASIAYKMPPSEIVRRFTYVDLLMFSRFEAKETNDIRVHLDLNQAAIRQSIYQMMSSKKDPVALDSLLLKMWEPKQKKAAKPLTFEDVKKQLLKNSEAINGGY